MKLSRAAFDIFIYRVMESEGEPDQDVLKNGYMIVGNVLQKCNYFTSVEGIIVSHIIRKNLRKHLPAIVADIISYGMITFEMLLNIGDDFVGYQLSFMGFKQHADFYNAGVILGRLSKNIVAFYMQGWFDFFLKVEQYV